MTRRLSFGLLFMVLGLVGRADGAGTVFEIEYPPSTKPGELVYGVLYRVWIPDGVKTLRGVIVHQHGCGKGACQGGETAADDLHWRALARKWNCALLGPSFRQEDGQNCRLWCDPRNGSRARFLQALDDLGRKSGHPELATVPWCLWGHSGGGFWASLMMMSDPDRIVAAWLRSGTAITAWEKGEIPKPEIPKAAYGIPVVCNPGVKENADARFRGAWTGAMTMFTTFRSEDAPIAFAPDPRTGHECGESRDLAIPFFDACLAARLPDEGTKLKPMPRSDARLGRNDTFETSRVSEFVGDAKTASFLPNETVAKVWTEYAKTGTAGDSTPPPPPVSVTATIDKDKKTVRITWDAEADLESGLGGFVIERDGKEIGRLPRKPVPRFGRPLFQGMSYHDTPEKPIAAMVFVDESAEAGASHAYRVVSVNGAGVKSNPSAEATPR